MPSNQPRLKKLSNCENNAIIHLTGTEFGIFTLLRKALASVNEPMVEIFCSGLKSEVNVSVLSVLVMHVCI